jgi:hypothetical protein
LHKAASQGGHHDAKAGLTTTTHEEIVMATRSLSPKQIAERAQLARQAVMVFARLAAKRAIQDQLRAAGVRVSLVPPAEIMRQAGEYLASHPELYQLALERANKLGYIDPRGANVFNAAQSENEPKSTTSALQMSGAK